MVESLFDLEAVLPAPRKPSRDPLDDLHGSALRAKFTDTATAAATAVGKPHDDVVRRLLRNLRLKTLREADAHDLREGVREFQSWTANPNGYRTKAQPVRVGRPSGSGQLPYPRTTKLALSDTLCGLCGDVVRAGALIGRMKPPSKRIHTAMGWLCRHCLYARREVPRRRDVLVRMFHHLLAFTGVEFNDHEAQVLLDWLTADPTIAASSAWRDDPLETTLARLETSITEEKAATWLSEQTALTIVEALHSAPGTDADAALLRAISQHRVEWETNPQDIDHSRYGTGVPYRVEVLARTAHPTLLSRAGGPFDLHHAPPPETEEATDETGEAESAE
ncbi:hypothetical protein [Streptomyces sp. NPDC058254]|uniref:hypothetical protein n=1 Tax=Streptomyces sp. NPDC058254 TaxID=3346406 RepID=UPI0036EB682E